MKRKFKVGDFAIVIDNFTQHMFEPGEIVEITEILKPETIHECEYKISTPEDYWFANTEELFKIEL